VRKIVVSEMVWLDSVIQAPGGANAVLNSAVARQPIHHIPLI
jgi:hypothetical protein